MTKTLVPLLATCLVTAFGCSNALKGKSDTRFNSKDEPQIEDGGASTDKNPQDGGKGDEGGDATDHGPGASGEGGDEAGGESGSIANDATPGSLDADGADAGGAIDVVGSDVTQPCRYFDPAKKDAAENTHVVQGGPPIAVKIPNYTLGAGAGRFEGDAYVFTFTAYTFGATWTMNWDGVSGGHVPYRYAATISKAKTAACQITAELKGSDARTLRGCFEKTTRIRMADGREVAVDRLKVGDLVWNPATKRSARVAELIEGPETAYGLIEVALADGRVVVVTRAHPFETAAGLAQAKDLKTGDRVLDVDGTFHPLARVTVRTPDATAYVVNLRLDTGSSDPRDHMVQAAGLVSGDLYLQRNLEEKRVAGK